MELAIVTKIVSSVLFSGLEKGVNAARNKLDDKLKDRDVAIETWRKIIIEDLHDINGKIDGLSRKDLLASCSFLTEAIDAFKIRLKEANDEQTSKDEANGDQNDGSQTTATTTRNESESEVLNYAIALAKDIHKLNNTSNGGLASTEKYFRDACKEATRAFWNEALSLPDRIMAAKIRVASKILECLQDTKVATAGCIQFLKELHNLPAIRETFSTHFKGGIKSRFHKDSRLEIVKPVLALNFAISDFVARFSGELPDVRNWPRIQLPTEGEIIYTICNYQVVLPDVFSFAFLGIPSWAYLLGLFSRRIRRRVHETIQPLCLDIDIVKEIFDKEKFHLPKNQVNSRKIDWCMCPCINSKGQLLTSSLKLGNHINVMNRSGDIKTFCKPRQATASQSVKALAVDRYDNVFAVIVYEDCKNNYVNALFIFDPIGNVVFTRVLDFLVYDTRKNINCVVNNDNDILIHIEDDRCLYVCDSKGNLKSRLSLKWDFVSLECVTDQNEVVMRTCSQVVVCTKEGKLKEIRSVQDKLLAVTFNYATSKIEMLVMKESIFEKWWSYSIRSTLGNNEVESLYLPVKNMGLQAKFCSHPAGYAALVYDGKVIFL